MQSVSSKILLIAFESFGAPVEAETDRLFPLRYQYISVQLGLLLTLPWKVTCSPKTPFCSVSLDCSQHQPRCSLGKPWRHGVTAVVCPGQELQRLWWSQGCEPGSTRQVPAICEESLLSPGEGAAGFPHLLLNGPELVLVCTSTGCCPSAGGMLWAQGPPAWLPVQPHRQEIIPIIVFLKSKSRVRWGSAPEDSVSSISVHKNSVEIYKCCQT